MRKLNLNGLWFTLIAAPVVLSFSCKSVQKKPDKRPEVKNLKLVRQDEGTWDVRFTANDDVGIETVKVVSRLDWRDNEGNWNKSYDSWTFRGGGVSSMEKPINMIQSKEKFHVIVLREWYL